MYTNKRKKKKTKKKRQQQQLRWRRRRNAQQYNYLEEEEKRRKEKEIKEERKEERNEERNEENLKFSNSTSQTFSIFLPDKIYKLVSEIWQPSNIFANKASISTEQFLLYFVFLILIYFFKLTFKSEKKLKKKTWK